MSRPPLTTTLIAAVLAAAIALLPAGMAFAAAPKLSYTSAETQYMCTSCREPLALAQSPQAQSEKQFLAGLIHQGLTARQIQTQMVAQYGVAVLAKPPASGFNLTVYVLPPALLVLGVAGLVILLPKWRARTRRAAADQESAPPAEIAPADAERLDRDLARFI